MALPKLHSFDLIRGDDLKIPYVVKDQQDTPVVVDITAATFLWAVTRQDPTSNLTEPQPLGVTLISKSVGSGITIDDGPAGEVFITLDSADTVAFNAPDELYHELQMTLGGKVSTLAYGIISLKREINAPGP